MASIATSVTTEGSTTTYIGRTNNGVTFVTYVWGKDGNLKDSVSIQFPTEESFQSFVTSVLFPKSA